MHVMQTMSGVHLNTLRSRRWRDRARQPTSLCASVVQHCSRRPCARRVGVAIANANI